MAGYDFVFEISSSAILNLIKSQVRIGGNLINPPFEISVPISKVANGHAHIIVDDISIIMNANNTITLNMRYNNSSIILDSPREISLSRLGGLIEIGGILIQLVDAEPPASQQKVLAVDLGQVSTRFQLNEESLMRVRQLIGMGGLDRFLTDAASAQLRNYITMMGVRRFNGVTFNVDPGIEGSISPLRFVRLDRVGCITSPIPNMQGLAVFGILILANQDRGDPRQKTVTAITQGHDVCISISPEVFHSKIFCNSVVEALHTSNVTNLPGSCGSAVEFNSESVPATITRIADSFAEGHINIGVSARKTGFCYEWIGSLHVEIIFSANDRTITPLVRRSELVDSHFTIPWYCWVAGGILIPVGLAVMGYINIIGDLVAASLAGGGFQRLLAGALSSQNLPADLISISPQIRPEGLTLEGTRPTLLPAPLSPNLILRGPTTHTTSKVFDSGIYHSDECPVGDFHYTHFTQQQTHTYEAVPTLLGEPLELHWSVSANDFDIELTSNRGSISIPNVDTSYDFPLPMGIPVSQRVDINYTISDRRISLTNIIGQGNYAFSLNVRVMDPSGVSREARKSVVLIGDYVDIGDDYRRRVEECLRPIIYKMKDVEPKWPPLDNPRPEEIIKFIDDVATINLAETDNILALTKLAHGKFYDQASLSRDDIKAALKKTK